MSPSPLPPGRPGRRPRPALLPLLLLALCAPPAAAGPRAKELSVRPPVSWRGKIAARCRALTPLIYEVSREQGVDPGLVAALVRLESGFQTRARSSAGARGLMQVMPSVWTRLRCGDPWDARDNLRCGIKLLRGFLAHYDGHLIYALSAYAAGYGRASAARDRGGLPSNLRYVERVLQTRAAFLRGACRARR